MKNLIMLFVLLVSLFVFSANTGYTIPFVENNKTEISQEWVEYVLIGEQWYQITHLDDGSEIIVPVAAPIRD